MTTPNPRRRLPIITGAAVLVLAVVAVIAYVAFFRGSAKKRLDLKTTPTGVTGSAGRPADVVGSWKPATGSTAGFRVREKLAQLPAQSDAVGRTGGITGAVVLDTTGTQLEAKSADLTVDLTTLASDRSQRDRYIKTHGLETTAFPTAHFVLTQPVALAATATNGQPVSFSASGDLTIHGQTKPVTIPIQARFTGSQIDLVGSTSFAMSDYGITPPDIGGFVTVEHTATMEFEVLLEKS